MMERKRILVVEDNLLNREMLAAILSEQYEVLETENGQMALDILKENGDDVALIFLDMMMPIMDGFTFLKRIKADPELALIPVIVTTQSDEENDEVAALSHGATDFVPKPYRPQVILHRAASIINLRETAAMVNLLQYDRLTGLYTKDFFYRKVQEQLRDHPEREYSLVCSNVENFKLYNDAFGVAAGDSLLQEIASFMRKSVGESAICGRFSGDRFICLEERRREHSGRQFLMGEFRNDVSKRLKNMVMKWGIYEIHDRTIPVEQMCDRALLAVDSIKGQYNRFFAVYDDTLRGKLLREQAITDAMEKALAEEQFVIYLQPKYCLHDEGLAGAEALVRWVHPEMGFLPPGEFIPLFEKNGFITKLDQYVWEHVCAMLQKWKSDGDPVVPVSVNVSRADIYQSDLTETLLGITSRYGVDPKYLHLEITESAYTKNPEQIIETVDRLRQVGFIVEMDDFGSGYSSLNMLNQMNLDILKLDMKFIQSETEKPVEQGILRFVVSLARWMNLSVVAEGVETRQQLERLREAGCDYVQGYFFAKPMPQKEFESLMKTQMLSEEIRLRQQQGSFAWNLLLVDEDEAYREKVRELFEKEYHVLETADADEALALIRENGRDNISIIVLSATLPDGGTTRFLQGLRKDPMHWKVPILATVPDGDSAHNVIEEMDPDDFLCKRHPLSDLHRRVGHLVNMAASRERERGLQDAAFHDFLSGLLNRRGFYEAMDGLRQEDLPLAIYFFDLDDLHLVNSRHGHDQGDRMIQSFSEVLRRNTRQGDILCRYGGDEFVLILRRIDEVETIRNKGEKICRDFSESMTLPDGSHVSCSGGVALCRRDQKPSAKIIEHADQALHQVKKSKKGCCILWEDGEKTI